MKIIVLVILNTIIISFSFAQEKKFIRQGNNSYESEDFENSELKYRKAIEKSATSFDANFNLGDALFKQEKFDEAVKQFENLAESETDQINKAKAYHNLGNSLLQSKDEKGQAKLQEAVEAYKNALRNNPKDNETRFNLAQAQKLLKQQQQQQKQNQDKNKDQDKKDQDKKEQDKKDQDKKDQEKKDEKKDKKDQDKKDQQKNKDQQDKQKQQEQKKQEIPKEKAEQMLKALENDEKDLQKKMKMQKVKGQKVKVEKDW